MSTLTTTAAYSLTQGDMNALTSLITAQANVSPGQAAVGQSQLFNFYGPIKNIAYDHVRLVQNAKVKGWLTATLDLLGTSNTNYSIDGKSITAAGMFVLYMYYDFNANCMQGATDWPSGNYGSTGYPAGYADGKGGTWFDHAPDSLADALPWNWFGPVGTSIFMAPNTYLPFYNSINDGACIMQHNLATTKNSTQTVALASPGTTNTFAQIQQFTKARFDPANWTNASTFVTAFNASSVITDQAATLKSMIASTSLQSGDYLFILYLLTAMSMSNPTNQSMAATVLNTVTNSYEYPNDTFCNTLCYFVMMELVDPLGDFGLDNTDMTNAVLGFESMLLANTPASNLLKTAHEKQRKILKADASYPLQDPYSNIPFDTRQSDILEALDAARGSMSL